MSNNVLYWHRDPAHKKHSVNPTGQALLKCDWKHRENGSNNQSYKKKKLSGFLSTLSANTTVGGLWVWGIKNVRKWTHSCSCCRCCCWKLRSGIQSIQAQGALNKNKQWATITTCYKSLRFSVKMITKQLPDKMNNNEECCQWLPIIAWFNVISVWPNSNCVTAVWLLQRQLVPLTAIKPAP